MTILTGESLQMVSEPAFLATMVDKHGEDDGSKKLETQFQSFADETNKRFERMEERQNRFESKLNEFAESSKRVEEMLQQMISRRQQQPASLMKSQIPISQAGNMVEIDQSSVGGNLTSNTHILFPHESYDCGGVLVPSVTGTGLNNWYYSSTYPSDSKSPALPLPWVATVCAIGRQSQADHVFDQCPQRAWPPFHEFSIHANFENEGLTLSENLESETNSCGNSIPSFDEDGFPFISTNGGSEAETSGDEETVSMCQSDEGLLNDLVIDGTGVGFNVTTSSWLPMFIEENESTKGSILENYDDKVPIGIEIEDEETAELKEDQVFDNYFHRDNAGTPVTIATLTNVVILKAQTALNWKSVMSEKLQLFELRSEFHGVIEQALREGLKETKQLEVIVHRSFKNTVVSLTEAVARVKLKKNEAEEEILFQVYNHQTIKVLNASILMCAKGDEVKAFVQLEVEDYIIWISILTIVSSQDRRSEIALNIYSEMRKGSCKMYKLSSTIIHRADTLLNTTEIGVFPSNDSGRLKKMIEKEMLIIIALAKAFSLMPLIGVHIGESCRIVIAIVKIMRSKVMQQLLFWSSITESMDDMLLALVSTIIPNICTQYSNLLWVPKSIPYGGSTKGLKEIGQAQTKTWLEITITFFGCVDIPLTQNGTLGGGPEPEDTSLLHIVLGVFGAEAISKSELKVTSSFHKESARCIVNK